MSDRAAFDDAREQMLIAIRQLLARRDVHHRPTLAEDLAVLVVALGWRPRASPDPRAEPAPVAADPAARARYLAAARAALPSRKRQNDQ